MCEIVGGEVESTEFEGLLEIILEPIFNIFVSNLHELHLICSVDRFILNLSHLMAACYQDEVGLLGKSGDAVDGVEIQLLALLNEAILSWQSCVQLLLRRRVLCEGDCMRIFAFLCNHIGCTMVGDVY